MKVKRNTLVKIIRSLWPEYNITLNWEKSTGWRMNREPLKDWKGSTDCLQSLGRNHATIIFNGSY